MHSPAVSPSLQWAAPYRLPADHPKKTCIYNRSVQFPALFFFPDSKLNSIVLTTFCWPICKHLARRRLNKNLSHVPCHAIYHIGCHSKYHIAYHTISHIPFAGTEEISNLRPGMKQSLSHVYVYFGLINCLNKFVQLLDRARLAI